MRVCCDSWREQIYEGNERASEVAHQMRRCNTRAFRSPPIITGAPVDGEYVEIGLLVPATTGPEAEEHDALCVRLDHQVPAEGDGGRVGILVCDGRHLVADVVSPHWRMAPSPAGLSAGGGRFAVCWWTGPRRSPAAISAGKSCAITVIHCEHHGREVQSRPHASAEHSADSRTARLNPNSFQPTLAYVAQHPSKAPCLPRFGLQSAANPSRWSAYARVLRVCFQVT